MSDTEILLTQVRRVERMLSDPHPGLFTWQAALASEMNKLIDLWDPARTPPGARQP